MEGWIRIKSVLNKESQFAQKLILIHSSGFDKLYKAANIKLLFNYYH